MLALLLPPCGGGRRLGVRRVRMQGSAGVGVLLSERTGRNLEGKERENAISNKERRPSPEKAPKSAFYRESSFMA